MSTKNGIPTMKLSTANIVKQCDSSKINRPPVANDDSYFTSEDVVLNVDAPGVLGNDVDADGDTLTAELISGTANGQVTLNADGSFTYTPDANFVGIDSFTYNASDGTIDSNTATVTIDVSDVNDPPTADDQNVETVEDTAVGILLTASDPDGDPLAYEILDGPARGALTGTAPTLTYTPDENYNGPDSFTFRVNDGIEDSNEATVTITVNPVNDDPEAVPDYAITLQAVPIVIDVITNDTDIDGDSLEVSSVQSDTAFGGTVINNNNGTVTYVPRADFTGIDTFTYTISDGNGGTDTAVVTVTVNGAPTESS